MYLSFIRQKQLFLLKTLNFELNSSNKAILIQRKIETIFLCCLWAFDQLEVPDGVNDGNLQSLVSIPLAFKSRRIYTGTLREKRLTNTVPWSLSKSCEAELVGIIFRIEVLWVKLVLKLII